MPAQNLPHATVCADAEKTHVSFANPELFRPKLENCVIMAEYYCQEHIMLLPMTPERFMAIRRRVMERRLERLASEIAAETDWAKLRRFDVDEFFKFLDSLVEPPETPPPRSRKRP